MKTVCLLLALAAISGKTALDGPKPGPTSDVLALTGKDGSKRYFTTIRSGLRMASADTVARALDLLVDDTVRLRHSSRLRIQQASSKDDHVGRVLATFSTDPSSVLFQARTPGTSTVLLKDELGSTETIRVTVYRGAVLPVGVGVRLTARSGKPIVKVENPEEKVVRVRAADAPDAVRIEPLAPGQARILLTDSDGQAETCLLIVRKPDLLLTAGDRKTLQLSTRRPIKSAASEYPKVVRVEPDLSSPQSIILAAAGAGVSRVVLTDDEGKQESYEVGVRPAKK